MRRILGGLVAVLLVATAPSAFGQAQPPAGGALFPVTGGNGAANGTRTMDPSGRSVCVFEYFITAGTATLEVQQRIRGPLGNGRWTTVSGSSSAVDGFKFSITLPAGEYRGARTAGAGATHDINYQCVKTLVQ